MRYVPYIIIWTEKTLFITNKYSDLAEPIPKFNIRNLQSTVVFKTKIRHKN